MRVVMISGSLRAGSSNTALLRAAAQVAPPGMELVLYEGIGELPHFNPDLDGEGAVPPPAVAELRALLAAADGALFSTPEYALGLPGSFKNAFDWLVSSGELYGKPALILNAAPAGADRAQAALVQTLTMISMNVLPASRLTPFVQKRGDAAALLADPGVAAVLREALAALADAMGTQPNL